MPKEKEIRLRRFAMQIAQQLPENKAESLMILAFIRQIIVWENGEGGSQIVNAAARLLG